MLRNTENLSHNCNDDRIFSYAGTIPIETYCLTCHTELMAVMAEDGERRKAPSNDGIISFQNCSEKPMSLSMVSLKPLTSRVQELEVINP
jgi:hypothetical protein